MINARLFGSAMLMGVLVACSGGGGGGSAPVPGGGSNPTPPPPSVSGDMLALSPGRGWNYQETNSTAGTATVSLYTNVDKVANNTTWVLAATGVPGLVPTALTDHATAESNLLGGLGLQNTSSGYNVNAYVTAGSSGAVPGDPLLVASTLTQGQVFTPYAGVTATVEAVTTMPNASACVAIPSTTGASVRYVYNNSTAYTIDYIPGCGITQVTTGSGVVFNLVSMGDYSSIGNLSVARQVPLQTLMDTARSALGLNKHGNLKRNFHFF